MTIDSVGVRGCECGPESDDGPDHSDSGFLYCYPIRSCVYDATPVCVMMERRNIPEGLSKYSTTSPW
jgi:hypothetical protein